MPSVDDVIEGVRAAAGADFCFVLTMRGRLVTHDAPRDMPEAGRSRIVTAAREIGDGDVALAIEMPRELLVPFGGAAPVDVFVATAGGQAIVCVVMASWADKTPVIPAIQEGLRAFEPMIAAAAQKRKAGKRRVPPGAPAPGAAVAQPASAPPRRGAMAGLLHLSGSEPRGAARKASLLARLDSPEIRVDGEAPVGRETREAIDREDPPRAPALPGAKGSAPDVRVELVSMGRQTEADIRLEEARRMQSLAAVPDTLIAPAASRMTQPWVEDAGSTKRSTDAAVKGRKASPPKVTVKLEDADEETLEALLLDQVPDGEADAEAPPSGQVPSQEPRKPQSSLDVWREGLAELAGEGPEKKKNKNP